MNLFIINYLQQHNSYNNLVVVGNILSEDDFNNIFSTTNITNISIYSDAQRISNNKNISFYDLKDFKINNNKDRLFILNDETANLVDVNINQGLILNKNKKLENGELWLNFGDKIKNLTIYKEEPVEEVLKWDSSNEIALSVILPTYNVAKYLAQCIESLIDWKNNKIEFIFVNDGSTDDGLGILQNYQKIDSRIKIINQANAGCAAARQTGLDAAKGTYVGFVDPDDFVDKQMFKKLLIKAMSGMYQICYCGYNEFYDDTKEIVPVNDRFYEPTRDERIIDDLIANRRIAIWRGIYLNSFLKINNIGFHKELRRFDDLPFKVETTALAKSVASIKENLYFYRLNRKGQDVSCTDQRLFVHFDIFEILDEFFKNYRNARQLDFYNIVKCDTHSWALNIIDSHLKDFYFYKAAKDLAHYYTLENTWNILRNYEDKKRLSILKEAKQYSTKKLLSIIIPCYNSEKFIGDCIQSILNNCNNREIEIICVDDGSSDKTISIVKEFAKNNSFIKLIQQKHKGVSEARNVGISNSNSIYIWFVDSDDIVLKNSIEMIYNNIRNCQSGEILCFNSTYSKIATNCIDKKPFNSYFKYAKDDPYIWNKVYLRSFIEKNKLLFNKKLIIGEDALFNFEAFAEAKIISYHKENILEHKNVISSTMNTSGENFDLLINNHFMLAYKFLSSVKKELLLENKDVLLNYLDALIGWRIQKNKDHYLMQIKKLEKTLLKLDIQCELKI